MFLGSPKLFLEYCYHLAETSIKLKYFCHEPIIISWKFKFKNALNAMPPSTVSNDFLFLIYSAPCYTADVSPDLFILPMSFDYIIMKQIQSKVLPTLNVMGLGLLNGVGAGQRENGKPILVTVGDGIKRYRSLLATIIFKPP